MLNATAPDVARWGSFNRGASGDAMDTDWLRPFLELELWSLREAAYLLCGQRPRPEKEFIREDRDGAGAVGEMYRSLKDATLALSLPFIEADGTFVRRRVYPSSAVLWANVRGLQIPAALRDVLPSPPEFFEQARPLQVDPEMLALDPESIVRFVTLPGLSTGVTQCNVGACIASVEEQIARQARGLFTLDEAAHLLVEVAPGSNVQEFIRRMQAARVRGRPLPRGTGDLLPVRDQAKARDFMVLVKVEDINSWLEDEGAPYRFPPGREPYRLPDDPKREQSHPEPLVTSAELAPEADEAAHIKPVARWHAQEQTILDKLRELGYSPDALPRHKAWTPGVKSQVRAAIGSKGMWQSATVFDKAWERLRKRGDIAEKG